MKKYFFFGNRILLMNRIRKDKVKNFILVVLLNSIYPHSIQHFEMRPFKCREKEKKKEEDWVHIRPILNSHKIRMNFNFGMRFTTSSSVAREVYSYKIWKWYESKNFIFEERENRPFCDCHGRPTFRPTCFRPPVFVQS